MDNDAGKPQSAVNYVLQHSQHKRNTGYVLIKLAQCIDAGNHCPSHNDLATMTGLSRDTVRRVLGELSKDGTIVITKNGGDKIKGGQKDCYAIAALMTPEEPTSTQQPGSNHPGSMVQPGSNQPPSQHEQPETGTTEYVRTGGDAAGEKDLSDKQKDKKPLLPAKAGKSNMPPDKLTGVEYADLLAAIGDVFGAFEIEATNYGNMLTGRAKKGKWGQNRFDTPVLAPELRAWWAWYKRQYPNVTRVKDVEKVHSSIAEYRRIQAARPPKPSALSPVKQTAHQRWLEEQARIDAALYVGVKL